MARTSGFLCVKQKRILPLFRVEDTTRVFAPVEGGSDETGDQVVSVCPASLSCSHISHAVPLVDAPLGNDSFLLQRVERNNSS